MYPSTCLLFGGLAAQAAFVALGKLVCAVERISAVADFVAEPVGSADQVSCNPKLHLSFEFLTPLSQPKNRHDGCSGGRQPKQDVFDGNDLGSSHAHFTQLTIAITRRITASEAPLLDGRVIAGLG